MGRREAGASRRGAAPRPSGGSEALRNAPPVFRAVLAVFLLLAAALPARAFDPVTLSERSYFLKWMPPSLPSNDILSLLPDPADTRAVYVGTSSGLAHTNGRFFRRYGIGGEAGPVGADVNALLAFRHYLVAATDDGLSVYNGLTEKWSHHTKADGGLPTNYVQCLAEYGAEILVGTWGGGVRLFDPLGGTFRDFPIPGFEGRHVTALLADVETKRVAVGTLRHGVALVTPAGVKVLKGGEELPSERVNGLAGSFERLLVATAAGLYERTPEASRTWTAADGMTSSCCLCVALFDDEVWVGTDRGISRLAGGAWTAYPVKNALSGGKPVRATALARAHGRLWVGTQHHGLLVDGGAGR